MTIHAKVTAYKGKLVIELLARKSIVGECHLSIDNPGVIGQIIHDTEKHLGVSAEAMDLIRMVPRGRDSIGDIDWFQTAEGKDVFGWLGGPNGLFDPKTAQGSRQWHIGKYVEIENVVPEEAKEAIDG